MDSHYTPQDDIASQPMQQQAPQLPPRPARNVDSLQVPNQWPEPPKRRSLSFGDDITSPIHYSRDPHKLVAYLVPFPKPANAPANLPDRFLIYTPPPPPIQKPAEGEKEDKMHKLQRKWQEEVRAAKQNTDKVTSWKGIKSKATRGINTAMGWTTTSNLDFLNRVPSHTQKDPSTAPAPAAPAAGKADAFETPGPRSPPSPPDTHADDGHHEEDTVQRTVGLEEMVLIHPASMAGSEADIRAEFASTMLRSRDKAQRDAVIATGLLPVSAAVDIMATLVWPFGGLLEIDSVWLYSSVRGAKTARSVTRRLNSSAPAAGQEPMLRLSFVPSPRLDVLRRYLLAVCHGRDPWMFKSDGRPAPTETEVLEAIGWNPSSTDSETRNWEDEQWEIQEVKEDLKMTMGKGAKEWAKWCKAFEKNPEKALKK